MKLHHKLCILLLSLLPISAVADSTWFYLYIHNTLNTPLYFSSGSEHKIDDGPNWMGEGPDKRVVNPGQYIEIARWSKGGTNGEKRINFYADAVLDEDDQAQGFDYNLKFEWRLKNTADGDEGLHWKSRIEDVTTYGNESEIIPYTVSTAMCSHDTRSRMENCLNRWVVQDSANEHIDVTIGVRPLEEGFFRFDSLNLGDVFVTTAYGAPTEYDPISNAINLSDVDEKFDIRFSKTTRFCKVRHGDLTCPSTIGYWFTYDKENKTNPDEQFVFACLQTEAGDTACPWTLDADPNDIW